MKLSKIAQICDGRTVNAQPIEITRLLTDSRKLFVAQGTLFIAVRGARHDGALFVADLYARGIRAFVCHTGFDTSAFPEASFVLVSDTTLALQQIAGEHRREMKSDVVAIVGSNGKTIVKEWLSQLIGGDRRTIRSPRSYNSQIGVPLSLWLIEPETELSVIEAGISMPAEMARLESIVAPNDVIFTNIGDAHQENFSSLEEKLNEKLVMCKNAKRIFYCKDQKMVADAIERNFGNAEKISWGKNADATYRITASVLGSTANLTVEGNGKKMLTSLNLTDTVSIENACHAICYALTLGIDTEHIAERVTKLQSIGMRLEQKEGHNNCTIIDDAYNADITSLEIALDMLHVLGDKKGLSRTLILSDMQQTGLDSAVLYQRVTELLNEKKVNRLIGIGGQISQSMANYPNATFFATTKDFLASMSTGDFANEAILLKGSRNFGFERIAEMLERRRNRTVMEINMNALAHNIAYFRKYLSKNTKLLAMVKAYSYGTGSFEIAKLMQEQGGDYLGVAFADEGYDLRVAGISLPIIVMNPEEHSYDLMLQYDLEPEIYSVESIFKYSAAAAKLGIGKAGIHIKINTGMMRSGFEPDEMDKVAQTLALCPNLKVISAFSHLVGSDEACHDEFTHTQLSRFDMACRRLNECLGYSFLRHVLNSAGIERFSDHQCEMVRLGIGLYGVSAIDNSRLRNVATLKSYISQIRDIEAGESVGYSRKTILKRKSRIAVVPIGYADGLDRRLSNGVGVVLVHGKPAPISGNVCMDICMIDVTDIPEAQTGDEVVLLGDQNPVWDMADKIGTICYEILTGIGRRVKRIYYFD